MILQSIAFQGFGTAHDSFSIQLPRKGIIRGKTGSNKSIIFEVLKHVFGTDISHLRTTRKKYVKDSSQTVDLIFNVKNNQYKLTREDRPKEEPHWKMTDMTSNKIVVDGDKIVLFSYFKNHFNISLGDLSLFFISERSSLLDVVSFDRFIKSTSREFSETYTYYAMLSSLMSQYKQEEKQLQNDLKHDVTIKDIDNDIDEGMITHALSEKKIDTLESDLNTIKEDLLNIKRDEKNAEGIMRDKELIESKIKTFNELVETKEKDIKECENQLKTHGGREAIEEMMSCARKTDVNLNVKLRGIDNDLSRTSKEMGRLESNIASLRMEVSNTMRNIEKTETALEKERMDFVLLGIAQDIDLKSRKKTDDKIRMLQEVVSRRTNEESLVEDEMTILRKCHVFATTHGTRGSCPCCGNDFQSNNKLSSIIKERMEIQGKKLKEWSDEKKDLRSNIMKLRHVGDVTRSMILKDEQIKKLRIDRDTCNNNISGLKGQLENVITERSELLTQRDNILELLHLEEKLINGTQLLEKINMARVDLDEFRTQISGLIRERVFMEKRLSKLPLMKVIETDYKNLEKKRDDTNTQILKLKSDLLDTKAMLKSLVNEKKRLKTIHEKIALLAKKGAVSVQYVTYFETLLSLIEKKFDANAKEIANGSDDLNIVSVDRKKGEIIRNVNGTDITQNLISLSTGERVMISVEAKARNNVWGNGGFVIIDANMSNDIITKCARVLEQHGCEQFIFTSLSNSKLQLEDISSVM